MPTATIDTSGRNNKKKIPPGKVFISSPDRKAKRTLRPRPNIFLDFLFNQEERSMGFPMLLRLSTASRPAFRYFQLKLTSLRIMFYHPPRGDESTLALEHSFGQRRRKRKLLSFIPGGEW
jgi:hypothetical protein